jgi:calreticulin
LCCFQGKWKAPEIDNPDFVDDKELYKRGPIGYVAFEIWQVKSGSIFDNILLTDSKEEAIQFAKDTWGKQIEGEKAMKAKVEV